ncbi:MAG TPA: class I SAM-dependent methyltransferase [Actinoplanes sp.]|jgi:2-polyprenyl-3-methyl-5-hydroxy-6-metoxy-1,4-benzoquinol methylase|nr:class I SAM-dependent methyltransferase [Actinoplanes sp.]
MNTALWDVYARCYDAVARLRPYEKMVREIVGEVPERPGRVLDAGCGTGNLTRALTAKQPAEIVAADLSAVMLRRSRRKNPGVRHVRADLDGDLAEVSGVFDVIVCGHVLYALRDPARALATLKSRLAPGGRLVLTTPRAGAAMGPIVREHGVLALWRFLLPLLVVGAINARILRTSSYHFLTRAELSTLLGTDEIRPTYSGQSWLAVYAAS